MTLSPETVDIRCYLQTSAIKIHVRVAAVACKGATVHPAADAVLRLDPPDAGGPHPPAPSPSDDCVFFFAGLDISE